MDFIFGLARNLSVSFGSCMSSVALGKHVGIMLCDFLYNGKIGSEDRILWECRIFLKGVADEL